MAAITPVTLTPLSEAYGSATAGQVVTPVTPAGGGDSVTLAGSMLILRFQTTGTASVITLDSVELSNFGSDVNVAVSLGATSIQVIAVKTDPRFKQTSAPIGSMNMSYTSVAALNIEAYNLA